MKKNENHTVTTILSPASVDVEGNVVMTPTAMPPITLDGEGNVVMTPLSPPVRINQVDLSEDVLTYKAGDEKTFTAAVIISGDLNVVPGDAGTGDLTIPTDSDIILVNDQNAEVIAVNIADR